MGNELVRVLHPNDYEKNIFDNYSDGVIILDVDGFIKKVNFSMLKISGFSEAELKQKSFNHLIKSSDIEKYIDCYLKTIKGEIKEFDTYLLDKEGNDIYVHVILNPIIENKKISGVYILLKKDNEMMNESENVQEAIYKINLNKEELICYSEELYNISGINPNEIRLNLEIFMSLIHPEDLIIYKEARKKAQQHGFYNVAYRIIRKNDHSVRTVYSSGEVFYDGKIKTNIITGRLIDVTERVLLEKQLNHLMFYDSLTNLGNSKLLNKVLYNETNNLKSNLNEQKMYILYLDTNISECIDNIIEYNMREELIIKISLYLKTISNNDLLLFRIKEREFVFCMKNASNIEEVEQICKTILEMFNQLFSIDNYEIFINVNIGISTYPDDSESVRELVNKAYLASKLAVQEGSVNSFNIYNPKMNINNYRLFELQNDFIKAIDNNQIKLYYQPQFNYGTKEICGVEAYIYWKHDYWGVISQNEIYYLIEKTGSNSKILEWSLSQICKQYKIWKDKNLKFKIYLNATLFLFIEKNTFEKIEEILNNDYGFDFEWLFFILDSKSCKHRSSDILLKFIQRLRKIGVSIALTNEQWDFSLLNDFDILKPDKLIINFEDMKNTQIMMLSISDISKKLNTNIILKGINSRDTYNNINFNIDSMVKVQGNYFCEFIPPEEIGKTPLETERSGISSNMTNNIDLVNREYFRMPLHIPLGAKITISKIKNSNIETSKAHIAISDISAGGILFRSSLNFPITEDIILEIETKILNNYIKIFGKVIRKKAIADNYFEYGLEFILDEIARKPITKLMNDLQVHLKRNKFTPNYKLVEE